MNGPDSFLQKLTEVYMPYTVQTINDYWVLKYLGTFKGLDALCTKR
jgi:hypothetical protein